MPAGYCDKYVVCPSMWPSICYTRASVIYYLGCDIHSSGSSESEVRRRITLAKCCSNQLNRGIRRSSTSLNTKIQLHRVYIQPILLYGSETWAIAKTLQDMIDAFDKYCLRRILGISYRDRITIHQCHCLTSLGFSSQTVTACPNKTTPLLWACGEDGSLTRH